jgi:DNA-binding beta-propeller fold protein YncE
MGQALVPGFPSTLQWLNATTPSTVARRGWLTAVAFVNLGSSWSVQALLELQALRARFPHRLRAFAIHVPRFEYERNARRVMKRANRHGITLPLALDEDWVAWQHFGVRAWPTVVLVDEAGHVQARMEGNAFFVDLEKRLQDHADAVDESDTSVPRHVREPDMPLRFPVGLAVTSQYLYVADSGHHRILECNHAGRILRTFGSGDAGHFDGDSSHAAFHSPHGLSLLREMLYVADTGNHAVRRINLRTGDIDTLVGNGRRGTPKEGPVGDPRGMSLDSPRAVAATNEQLHIALAGDNRIWSYDFARGAMIPRAGNGKLDVKDGPGNTASFAQPVALAAVQQTVYVCDAAGSAIRSLATRDNLVQTLLGQGPFAFGHVDGPRNIAQLQDPQAIALDPDAPLLWIADAGNDRLRSLRLGGGDLTTHMLPQPLHGPSGLAVGAGAVWIADTDAHSVLRVDPKTGAVQHVPIGE